MTLPQLRDLEAHFEEHPPLHMMVEAFLLSRSKKGGSPGRQAPAATNSGRGTMEDLARTLGANLPPAKKNPEVNRG